MKKMAIANQKGGVGKTSTAVHTAHYWKRQGKRVLFVDFDGQRNGSSCFGYKNVDPSKYLTATGLLLGNPDGLKPLEVDGFGLVAGDRESDDDVNELDLSCIGRPAQVLETFSADYDLCVMDCPPSLGRRLLAALCTADYVLTPFTMEKFSLDGIGDLMDTIRMVRRTRMNPRLAHLGILPNMLNNRSSSQTEALAELRAELGGLVLPVAIADRTSVSDALTLGLPVWELKKGGESTRKAATEMLEACADIYARVEK